MSEWCIYTPTIMVVYFVSKSLIYRPFLHQDRFDHLVIEVFSDRHVFDTICNRLYTIK